MTHKENKESVKRMKIILHANSNEPEAVELGQIQVPDLWHLAMWLKDNPPVIEHHHIGLQNFLAGKPASAPDWAELVLETWHLCHDLIENFRRYKDETIKQ